MRAHHDTKTANFFCLLLVGTSLSAPARIRGETLREHRLVDPHQNSCSTHGAAVSVGRVSDDPARQGSRGRLFRWRQPPTSKHRIGPKANFNGWRPPVADEGSANPPNLVVRTFRQLDEIRLFSQDVTEDEGMTSRLNVTGYKDRDMGGLNGDRRPDTVGLGSDRTGHLAMGETPTKLGPLALDRWTYLQVDDRRPKWGDYGEPKWLKYFGLAMADLTHDGFLEVVAGRHFYRNPGGPMTGKWERVDFGKNVDAMLVVDVDGDARADVIATALPGVYWLEAEDPQADRWSCTQIGTLPETGHVNGQGYMLGQVVAGGKPEIILACGDGTYYLEIPDLPRSGDWPKTRIVTNVMDEGIGVADIDRDGHLDIAVGKETDTKHTVIWLGNPGDGGADWKAQLVGPTDFAPDRIVLADISGDGRCDVVVSEERYPGPDPDASLYWFEQPTDLAHGKWTRHGVVTQYSLNNLDVADIDRDGDMDIVTCEHKGPRGQQKLQVFANDGRGAFAQHVIDRGKESHLGARVADLDGDGDLDIISVGWDQPQFVHVWRNDAVQ